MRPCHPSCPPRYELESKYTQFVNVHSRPVWPRLDFGTLATVLNQIDAHLQQQQQQHESGSSPRPLGTPGSSAAPSGRASPQQQPAVRWMANRFTDTGPMLRLERPDLKLSKAQRYGHPTERPFFSSAISPSEMRALVISYLDFGQQGLAPQVGAHAHLLQYACLLCTLLLYCTQLERGRGREHTDQGPGLCSLMVVGALSSVSVGVHDGRCR